MNARQTVSWIDTDCVLSPAETSLCGPHSKDTYELFNGNGVCARDPDTLRAVIMPGFLVTVCGLSWTCGDGIPPWEGGPWLLSETLVRQPRLGGMHPELASY